MILYSLRSWCTTRPRAGEEGRDPAVKGDPDRNRRPRVLGDQPEEDLLLQDEEHDAGVGGDDQERHHQRLLLSHVPTLFCTY